MECRTRELWPLDMIANILQAVHIMVTLQLDLYDA